MLEYYDPNTYPKQWNYLQSGTIIDQYIIERELAHGGFSSVYLARQISNLIQVAIKEYLPRKLAHRTWNKRRAWCARRKPRPSPEAQGRATQPVT